MNGDYNLNRLEVRQISKSFDKKEVVRSVSFYVDSGNVVGLLGPNGAGKTTCFNMVIGLESCDSGTIWLNDTDITQMPIYARARLGVGYLPQEASIFRRLNVEENVMAVLESQSQLSRAERTERVDHVLNDFHIGHLRKQPSTTLSGGERRRLEIARAIALNPRFILLDEPFAGVDPIAVDDVIGLIQVLSEKNVGVLITDHNVRETLNICHYAMILSDGSIIAEGNIYEIMQNEQVRNIYLGKNFRI